MGKRGIYILVSSLLFILSATVYIRHLSIIRSSGIVSVPDDFPSIQQAIDSVPPGTFLEIREGVYNENIDFRGKEIIIKSKSGPQKTVLRGKDQFPVVMFISGEGKGSVIEGLTISAGKGLLIESDSPGKTLMTSGGGILCMNSSPTIVNNIIKDNYAQNGGGICCTGSASPLIDRNEIKDNQAEKGGGIRCSLYSSPSISNNTVSGNYASRLGGGIYWRVGSHPYLCGNRIIDNHADEKGGGIFGSSVLKGDEERIEGPPVIERCIISGNTAPDGPEIAFGPSCERVCIKKTVIEGERQKVSDPEGVISWE